jgi:hypothetical protein
MQLCAYPAFRDDLVEHYAGFTIAVALAGHRSGVRWTGDFTVIRDCGGEMTHGPYYGSSISATREEAKRAAFASARAEIDHKIRPALESAEIHPRVCPCC